MLTPSLEKGMGVVAQPGHWRSSLNQSPLCCFGEINSEVNTPRPGRVPTCGFTSFLCKPLPLECNQSRTALGVVVGCQDGHQTHRQP